MTRRMLTQNSELREIGVWNWSIPAWVVELSDGRTFNACPSAGACAQLCYARNGTYNFPSVKAAHIRNLEETLDDLEGWKARMIEELRAKRFRATGSPRPDVAPEGTILDPWIASWYRQGGRAVRIHDAGDFYSDEYLRAWIEIARATPDVLFYAYTKEVRRFRKIAAQEAPENLRWLFSMGGKEDHLIDREIDRHADVFPDEQAIRDAGYSSQEASDLYAITLPTAKVGIPANNIPAFRKKQGGSTFADLQKDRHRLLPLVS